MDKSICVAMIIQAYAPRIGGAETYLASVSQLLKERGIKVVVITRRYPGLSRFEKIAGIPVYRMPIPGPKAVASQVFTISVMQAIRTLRPNILHAHDLYSPTTTAVVGKLFYGTPIVVTLHGGGEMNEINYLKQKKLFGNLRFELFKKVVDCFIAISHQLETALTENEIPQSQQILIQNGVDAARFSPIPFDQKRKLRNELGFSDGPVAVYTGRLAPEKHIDQLLRVWPQVQDEIPDAQLVIVGSGTEEDALKKMASQGIRFIGKVSNVVDYLRASDLFVLPSEREGLSVAILEAMAVGLPVLATDVGGNPELIDHHKNGWLVPFGDSQALSAALVALLGNSQRRDEFGKQARETVKIDYALSRNADRLVELYKKLEFGGIS